MEKELIINFILSVKFNETTKERISIVQSIHDKTIYLYDWEGKFDFKIEKEKITVSDVNIKNFISVLIDKNDYILIEKHLLNVKANIEHKETEIKTQILNLFYYGIENEEEKRNYLINFHKNYFLLVDDFTTEKDFKKIGFKTQLSEKRLYLFTKKHLIYGYGCIEQIELTDVEYNEMTYLIKEKYENDILKDNFIKNQKIGKLIEYINNKIK